MNARLERNGEYWRAVWHGPDGRKHTAGLGKCSKRQAQKKLSELDTGATAARMLLDEWTVLYVSQRAQMLDESTLSQHATYLRRFAKYCGPMAVRDVTPMLIANWLGTLDVADSTRRKIVRYMRTIWKWAINQNVANANPWSTQPARHPRVDREVAYVSSETVYHLSQVSENAGVVLLGLTRHLGLRVGEALRAKWSDLGDDAFTVQHTGSQTTKRAKRRVPVSDTARDYLRRTSTEELMGPGVRRPYDLLRKLQRHSGIEPWVQPFHSLRASCETDLLKIQPLPLVAKWMGHSAVVALEHYHRDTVLQGNEVHIA